MNQAKASDGVERVPIAIDQGTYLRCHAQATSEDRHGCGTRGAKKEFDDKVADYEAKKTDWQNKAKGFEDAQAEASRKGSYMGTSISFLSIAIAMTSTCLLTKKKPLWFISILLALAGLGEMIYAWML